MTTIIKNKSRSTKIIWFDTHSSSSSSGYVISYFVDSNLEIYFIYIRRINLFKWSAVQIFFFLLYNTVRWKIPHYLHSTKDNNKNQTGISWIKSSTAWYRKRYSANETNEVLCVEPLAANILIRLSSRASAAAFAVRFT